METPAPSQSVVARRTIAQTFQTLRAHHRLAFMPFVPAGYPDLQTTSAVLPALQDAGADIIEVGIPFSDPIADGPTIQEAFAHTLARKVKLADILKTIAEVRPTLSIPLVAMVSYSIMYRHGVAGFIDESRQAGFDGLIIPDLPPPEAAATCRQIRAAGLDTIMFVAPTTSQQRRAEIVSLTSGFVYYLSISGITGARDSLPPDLEANVMSLRKQSAVPVCVGFGISRKEHLAQLAPFADGAIVGSGLVKRMSELAGAGAEVIAQSAASYCRELLQLVRR